jgi:hypothetical protein
VIFRHYGILTVEIADNKKAELAERIKSCPKGNIVQLNMKNGAVYLEII